MDDWCGRCGSQMAGLIPCMRCGDAFCEDCLDERHLCSRCGRLADECGPLEEEEPLDYEEDWP